MQLTPRVSVRQSAFWQTNTGIIRSDNGAILIDAGVLPTELTTLAEDLSATTIVAGLMTHGHWDHVLWSAELGVNVPRYANATTTDMSVFAAERRNTTLASIEAHPDVIGTWDRDILGPTHLLEGDAISIDGVEIRMIDVTGHCDGQLAFLLPTERVLFAADTLSDVEAPSLYGGRSAVKTYLLTLDRLETAIAEVDWIVPGHGTPCNRDEALARLRWDRNYLEMLLDISGDESETEAIAKLMAANLGRDRFPTDDSWQMHVSTVKSVLTN